MFDWNVVVTVHRDGFRDALRLLERFGAVERSEYFNVLVMRVADTESFLDELSERVRAEPGLLNALSRVVPVEAAFNFATAEEFADQARATVLDWAPRLAGASFHVRLHRRGFRGRLKSPEAERFLDDALLGALEAAGAPGRIRFADADAIIVVETVGNRAGLSLWTREQLAAHPILGLD